MPSSNRITRGDDHCRCVTRSEFVRTVISWRSGLPLLGSLNRPGGAESWIVERSTDLSGFEMLHGPSRAGVRWRLECLASRTISSPARDPHLYCSPLLLARAAAPSSIWRRTSRRRSCGARARRATSWRPLPARDMYARRSCTEPSPLRDERQFRQVSRARAQTRQSCRQTRRRFRRLWLTITVFVGQLIVLTVHTTPTL